MRYVYQISYSDIVEQVLQKQVEKLRKSYQLAEPRLLVRRKG